MSLFYMDLYAFSCWNLLFLGNCKKKFVNDEIDFIFDRKIINWWENGRNFFFTLIHYKILIWLWKMKEKKKKKKVKENYNKLIMMIN